ncbi:MAG: hypothetical protein K6A14_02850 [Erysipelotrichaceae bacterium]|nr:hypothetical protein [Erysipelotrichaceae bacterium]
MSKKRAEIVRVKKTECPMCGMQFSIHDVQDGWIRFNLCAECLDKIIDLPDPDTIGDVLMKKMILLSAWHDKRSAADKYQTDWLNTSLLSHSPHIWVVLLFPPESVLKRFTS